MDCGHGYEQYGLSGTVVKGSTVTLSLQRRSPAILSILSCKQRYLVNLPIQFTFIPSSELTGKRFPDPEGPPMSNEVYEWYILAGEWQAIEGIVVGHFTFVSLYIMGI